MTLTSKYPQIFTQPYIWQSLETFLKLKKHKSPKRTTNSSQQVNTIINYILFYGTEN